MLRLMTKADREGYKAIITKGRTKVAVKGADVEFYLTDEPYIAAMCFRGSAAKPCWRYKFKTVAEREKYLAAEIQAAKDRAKRNAEYKAERQVASTLEVGHIVVTSWGWEQTNREFFKVIEKKGQRTVVVQELEQIREEKGFMQGNTVPGENFLKGSKPIVCRVSHGNKIRPEGHYAYVWDGRPVDWTAYA